MITDTSAFKDLTHFGPTHNSWMVDCMAKNLYRITDPVQVQENNRKLQEEAGKYLESFRENFGTPTKVKELIFTHLV
jgi:hypothetical protein